MDFKVFLKEQNKIYSELSDTTKFLEEGTVPKLMEKHGSYFVRLKHSEEIENRVEVFSEKVSKIIPSLKYSRNNVHTTLFSYARSENFEPDKTILAKLTDSIYELNSDNLSRIEINYDNWLINSDAIIAAGMPNEYLFENLISIYELARKKGLDLKFPWGAHITAVRFLEAKKGEVVKNLIDVCRSEGSLKKSFPTGIDIGYFNAHLQEGFFNQHIHERLKFR